MGGLKRASSCLGVDNDEFPLGCLYFGMVYNQDIHKSQAASCNADSCPLPWLIQIRNLRMMSSADGNVVVPLLRPHAAGCKGATRGLKRLKISWQCRSMPVYRINRHLYRFRDSIACLGMREFLQDKKEDR